MTSREIVKRAIHFDSPPRIPFNFDSNRTPMDGTEFGEDMLWVSIAQRPAVDGYNEFGVQYVTFGETFGEPKTFPLEGKETLDGYQFPDFTEDWRYDRIRSAIRDNAQEKYVLGMLPNGVYQPLMELFGFYDFMVQLGTNLELVEDVCDRLTDMAIGVTEKMAACGVDGIITIDDTALQDRPMISMDMFRTIFKPRFKRLYDRCHALGLDTFIHSCGYTIDIIEELRDAGCQVFNLDQQDNMGIWELSKRYRGRVCFYCPLDIQRTVDMGPEEIEARVVEMISAFNTPKGGFIAKTYPSPEALHMSKNYLQTMTDAFKKYACAMQAGQLPDVKQV